MGVTPSVILIAAISIVGVVADYLDLGASPLPVAPVDVYGRPAPPLTAAPDSLIPSQIIGNELQNKTPNDYEHADGSVGFYEGGIRIEITKWDNASKAASFLSGGIGLFERLGSRITAVQLRQEHWFTFTGSDFSLFAWRRGVWVFDVRAPDEILRDQVVEELTLGKSFPVEMGLVIADSTGAQPRQHWGDG
ncbi:MAG: hypothetical protein ACE5LS_07315 [Thermoplasmata archaeon]